MSLAFGDERVGSPRTTPAATQPVLRAPPFGRRRPVVSQWQDFDRALDACATSPRAERDRAAALARKLADERLGGAFWAPRAGLRPGSVLLRPRSLPEGCAMLSAALTRMSGETVVISAPETRWAASLRGPAEVAGAKLVLGERDPWSLVEDARQVVAHADDPLAFHAAIAGRPVRWAGPRDLSGHDADALAQAFLLAGVTYRDPFSGEPCQAEDIASVLADWRRHLGRTHGVSACVGITPWKRRAVSDMLASPAGAPAMARRRRGLALARSDGGVAACWATRLPDGFAAEAARAGVVLAHMEDGFLRSSGLGAGLVPPLSLTLDRLGTHYDPAAASELTRILTSPAVLDPALLARAERLIERLRGAAVGKYGQDRSAPFARPDARRVVLVIGQVEDDASVRLGGGGVGGNLDLLARVRAIEPDAIILYRPHPDVEAGHRRGGVPDQAVLAHADQVVREPGLPSLAAAVDAVHALTSLAGFEAMLRGTPVVTHGHPFYAGWGLTTDLAAPPRGSLSLSALVAGALILYPLYLDPKTRLPCPPEVLVDRLTEAPPPPGVLARLRALQGRLAKSLEAGR